RSSVGGWLYEVAYHLAIRARGDAARRAKRERQAQEMPRSETVNLEEGREVYAVLDEELHRLPEKYRSPLVLCYLEGKTNMQAARELGWPTGSISSRLERARELLRDRLAGRGIALSAGGVAALLTENAAPAAVAHCLVENTVRAAIGFAAGKSAVAGVVSAEAVVLAEGMLNTMISTKLKVVAALLLAVGLLGTGTSVWVQQGTAAQAPAADTQAGGQPAPADGKKGDVYGDPLPEGALARMGTLRWRHPGAVTFVGYAAGGKELVTGCQDGWFRVWEVSTGKELRRFGKPGKVDPNTGQVIIEGNGGAVMAMPIYNNNTSAALTADGLLLASASQDGAVRLWETATGKELRVVGKGAQGAGNLRVVGGIMSLAFSPDGKQLALRGQSDQNIKLYDTASGNEIRTIGKPADPKRRVYFGGTGNTLAFSSDGKSIATVITELENNQRALPTVQLYETETGKEVRTIKFDQGNNFRGIGGLAFVPGSKLLAVGSFDGTIRFFDPESGKEERKIGEAGQQGIYVATMLFSPDGKTLATRMTNSPAIQLWNVEDGKEVRQLGQQQPAQAGGVQVLIGRVGGSGPTTLAFSPDGKNLAEGLPTSSVRLWEVATGKDVPAVGGHQAGVSNLAVSPDGKTLITRGQDDTVRQWDMTTGKELNQFKLAGAGNAVFSDDGRILACGVPNAVQLWDVNAGKQLRSIAVQGQPQFGAMVAGSGGLALTADG
ncbi:MAG: hypothetical protein JNM56_10575, partial [Planctomycetia bacterium]|nr:hypothetical protein [Planctomycetia bacterium]